MSCWDSPIYRLGLMVYVMVQSVFSNRHIVHSTVYIQYVWLHPKNGQVEMYIWTRALCQSTRSMFLTWVSFGLWLHHTKAAFAGEVVAACGVIAAGTILPGSSAHAKGVFDYLTGPLYEPIREDVPYWLRSMVWNDFRQDIALADIFTGITLPLYSNAHCLHP